MKPPYYDYARHMWRFYLSHPDLTVADASGVDMKNWIACNTAYRDMPDQERAIINTYASAPCGSESSAINQYAQEHSSQLGYVWNVIRRAHRDVAVNRGLVEAENRRK